MYILLVLWHAFDIWDFLGCAVVKNTAANAGNARDTGSILGWARSPGKGNVLTPVFLPGESHGQKSLVGYSPWGCKESDKTEYAQILMHSHYYRSFDHFNKSITFQRTIKRGREIAIN